MLPQHLNMVWQYWQLKVELQTKVRKDFRLPPILYDFCVGVPISGLPTMLSRLFGIVIVKLCIIFAKVRLKL